MKDFDLEYWDSIYPMDITISQRAPDIDFSFQARTLRYPPVEFQMTFLAPNEMEAVQSIALMYYQFDKFMKERYGDLIAQYQERERAKRIDLK
jgi:hypothetical protein